jgi:hypothetical protein
MKSAVIVLINFQVHWDISDVSVGQRTDLKLSLYKHYFYLLAVILSEKYYANIERNIGCCVITYSVTYVTCVFTWLVVGLWKGVGLRNTFVYDGVQCRRDVLTGGIFLGTCYLIRCRWKTVVSMSGPRKGQMVGDCEHGREPSGSAE